MNLLAIVKDDMLMISMDLGKRNGSNIFLDMII